MLHRSGGRRLDAPSIRSWRRRGDWWRVAGAAIRGGSGRWDKSGRGIRRPVGQGRPVGQAAGGWAAGGHGFEVTAQSRRPPEKISRKNRKTFSMSRKIDAARKGAV